MPLGPGDKSLQYAVGGARAGAFRGGALSAKVFCYVNDVLRDISDLSIRERKGAGADSASFIARRGWEPQDRDEVVIQQGSRNRITRLFGGVITSIDESNFETPENRIMSVSLSDWSWAMNADLVTGIFTGTYDEIALELMERFAPPGFTTKWVERGLPTVSGGIQFTQVLLSVAIDRLAKRGGIIWRMRYNKDLYFRLTQDGRFSDLRTVDRDNTQFKTFRAKRDYFNIVTRVDFECQGTTVLSEVSALESIVPVLDGSIWPASGLFKAGPQIVEYLNVVLGGGGSLVGPGASPSSAPSVQITAGAGMTTGRHGVAIAYETLDGTSLPSPRSFIDVGFVSAPASAATAGTPSSGGSMDLGTHRYYPVFRTAAGSTTAGPVSNIATVTEVAAPTIIGTAEHVPGPGAPDADLDPLSDYSWKYTFRRLSDGAETTPSPASNVLTSNAIGGTCRLNLSGCQNPPSGYVRQWYRTEGNGSVYKKLPDSEFDFHSEVGAYMFDGDADGLLGAVAPSSNGTRDGVVGVTNIPVSPSALVTHVDMYREFNSAGAATAKLAFSVTNGTTSANDSTANSGLGATVPSANTAVANRLTVGLQIGPDAVTGRKVYVTAADDEDGELKLATTVANNIDEEVEVSTADGSLGAAAELGDGSGLEQPAGVVQAGATEIPIAGVAPFQVGGGWAIVGPYVVRFAAASGTQLTGIPAAGVGSIPGPINYNTQIAQAPQLEGISSGSPDVGSLTYALLKGQDINIIARVDNLDAQAVLASKIGGDGVKTIPLQNRTLSYTEGRARAQAYLDRRSQTVLTATIKTKDCSVTVGRMLPIDLPAPQNVAETLEVQTVSISNFHLNPPVDPTIDRHGDFFPDRQLEAADDHIALEDLLRKDAEN